MYLEDVVSDIIDLDDRRAALTEFGAEHRLESRAGGDQNNFVSVKEPALDSEAHVAQLLVVDELGVDASAARGHHGLLPDLLHILPAIASGENVGQQ